jgi:hypothetical protein
MQTASWLAGKSRIATVTRRVQNGSETTLEKERVVLA